MKSLRTLLLLIPVLFFTRIASGQEAKLASNPPLGSALPLVESADGVHLKFPILLNRQTVVEPSALLRLVYVDPNAGLHLHGANGGGTGTGFQQMQHHHSGTERGPASTDGFGDLTAQGTFDPDHATKKEESQEMSAEVWREIDLFRDALNNAADLGTMLIYSQPGKPKPLGAQIDLPDGMLLGAEDNRIVVLALTSDSEAFQAGLQPQDEISLIDHQPVPGSLEEFMRLYRSVTQQARTAGQPYSFGVHRTGDSRLITVQVGAPPSIPSMF